MSLRTLSPFAVALLLFGCAEGGSDPSLFVRDGGTGPGVDGGGTPLPGTDGSVPGTDTGGSTPGKDTGGTGSDTGGCTIPAGKACGTLPQCGCSATQNCDVTATNGNTSCVAAGSKGLLQGCSDIGECQKGLTCVGGLCNPFCNGPADCTGSASCEQVTYTPAGGSSTPVPGFKVCLIQNCDVRNPSGLCGSANCALFDDGTSACVKAGTSTTKGGCTAADPFLCGPGYVCTNDTDCFKWCRVGFPGDCSGTLATTCTGFSTPLVVGGVTYGVCAY